MPAPRRTTGTLSPARRTVDGSGGATPAAGGGTKGGKPTGNGGKGAGKGGKKKRGGNKNYNSHVAPLNPPFDPRMRQIGNPLHNSKAMKRGWVQTDEDNLRVNFLFNPSQLDLNHGVNVDAVRNEDFKPDQDVMSVDYTSMGSSLSIKLLYDRTYELLGPDNANFASNYGVWADVAAWYVLLGMLPEMPTSWDNSLITSPPTIRTAYLFLGLRMVYYGYLTGINVTYSHWNQKMIPVRCSVDLAMELMPVSGKVPNPKSAIDKDVGAAFLADFIGPVQQGIDYGNSTSTGLSATSVG